MIFGKVQNAANYLGINPNLDKALAMLAGGQLPSFTTEKVDLDGERLWLSFAQFQTHPEETCFYEAHRRYADVHVVLEGEEKVLLANPAALAEYEAHPERDLYLYHGPAACSITCRPGDFLVVFPEDAHLLQAQVHDPVTVKKAVFKVLVV